MKDMKLETSQRRFKMAHWFHRNPLKATTKVNFDLKAVATTTSARQICSDLERSRNKLLDIIADPNLDISILDEASQHYLSLLHGFLRVIGEETTEDSKLRNILKFRWTNTLCGNEASEQQDAVYELFCIVFDLALWYMKHASKIAADKDDPKEEEAKQVHKCLRVAAGMFMYLKNEVAPNLLTPGEKLHDTDSRLLDCYQNQCTAEAQEIALARAIEKKHAASLRSALALETSRMFEAGELALKTHEDPATAKWRKYFQLKAAFYRSYAYCFHGEDLLNQDKCGEAVRTLKESQIYLQKTETLGTEYTKTKGCGTQAKPWEHLFFRKLGPTVTKMLEKCERENGFIYHQKVPSEIAELELKAEYGLAKPEPFSLPSPHKNWEKHVYMAFDLSKRITEPEKKKPETDAKKDETIPPIKEADIKHTARDPNNYSGCVLS